MELVIEPIQHTYAFLKGRVLGNWAKQQAVKPLFVCREGGLGDILCSFPAVEALAARTPGRPVAYICHQSLVDIPRLCPAVTQVFHARCNDLVARYLSKSWEVFAPRYADESVPPGDSRLESLAAQMIRASGLDPEVTPVKRLTPPPLSEQGAAWLERTRRPGALLVAIHTGPSANVRLWPASHWRQFTETVAREAPEIQILQVGPRQYFRRQAATTEIDATLPGVLDARAILSPMDTLAVLVRCAAFAGIDSGLLHAASGFGVPCVGLFGPTDPARRLIPQDAHRAVVPSGTLECVGCHHRNPRLHWESGCPNAIRCMAEIDIGMVLRNVQACVAARAFQP